MRLFSSRDPAQQYQDATIRVRANERRAAFIWGARRGQSAQRQLLARSAA
jgi:hypothetical protein